MGFDQKGFLVFRVQQGNVGKWNVMEVGINKPLASFDSQKDATEYAHDLGSAKDGSKVEIFNEHGKQIAEIEIAEFDAKDSSRRG